jgi:hypothetical protein
MAEEKKIIYRVDDNISFRKCSLCDGADIEKGDCTDFHIEEHNYANYYCNCEGLHFQCSKHPEIELDEGFDEETNSYYVSCPKCRSHINVISHKSILNKCLKMLNIEKLKEAKLVRLDDWYVPEIKKKDELPSDYWIKTDVKTDKDGDTIVVIYVGHKGNREKVQYFIKPEKGQMTNDHKDLDPGKVLSKVELTLKNKKITHKYDEQ